MSAYPLETIIHKWEKGKLTAEQAIGQILLVIQQMQERLSELESRVFRQERSRKL